MRAFRFFVAGWPTYQLCMKKDHYVFQKPLDLFQKLLYVFLPPSSPPQDRAEFEQTSILRYTENSRPRFSQPFGLCKIERLDLQPQSHNGTPRDTHVRASFRNS